MAKIINKHDNSDKNNSDTIKHQKINKSTRVLDSIRVEPLKNNQILKVRNLHVSFPQGHKKSIHIVRGVDLDVHRGEIIGLVGESGSGKSVTSKTLINVNESGIISADQIQIGEYELTNIKKQKYWQYIRGQKNWLYSTRPLN